MQYSEGQVGRVFVVRIDDGEDFLASMQRFIADKGIQSGSITFLGALMNGRMVTGPEEPVIPPTPHFVMFEGGWEVFGVGTIYPGEGGPHIHYHASVGRAGHALTGCLREKATTYLIVEAVIIEFANLKGRREFDERTQMNLPVLETKEEKPPEPPKEDEQKPAAGEEEKPPEPEPKDTLPAGLADIIRDLTRR
jgi:predicted DNA-binding protein with PD1-like motif